MGRHTKYADLDKFILAKLSKTTNCSGLARELIEEHQLSETFNQIYSRIKYVKRIIPEEEWGPQEEEEDEDLDNISESTTGDGDYDSGITFMPSAWNPDEDRFYTVEEYCDRYGLRKDLIKSSKLVAHVGSHMVYNIVFKEEVFDNDDFDYKSALETMLEGYTPPKRILVPGSGIGVITLTDLHFGAYVINLKRTQDFNVTVLINYLEQAAAHVNRLGYETVHVHMLGDLIESFTGLNHKNVWQSLQQGMFGANVVRQFVKMIDNHFLRKINNLGSIKVVAGNHDRATSGKDEDSEGWGADLISWGLQLMDYEVEFSSSVLVHTVDHVTYILNHGHLGLTKMTTEEICWNYGVKGNFNFIMEGHLHSRIKKLNAKSVKNFKLIQEDRIDCRRQICAPLFTGNSYSEQLGFSTTPGFTITEANFNSKAVNVFDFSV